MLSLFWASLSTGSRTGWYSRILTWDLEPKKVSEQITILSYAIFIILDNIHRGWMYTKLTWKVEQEDFRLGSREKVRVSSLCKNTSKNKICSVSNRIAVSCESQSRITKIKILVKFFLSQRPNQHVILPRNRLIFENIKKMYFTFCCPYYA